MAKGALDEVGAAHDFGDAEFEIVDDGGELVARGVVLAPDEEVAEGRAGDGGARPEGGVVERERLAVGDAKTPVHRDRRVGRGKVGKRNVGRRAESGRVKGFVVEAALMRGAGGFEDIAAGAGARVDEARGMEAGQGGAVTPPPGALRDDGFAPPEAQPGKVFQHRGDELGAATGAVEIVVAEKKITAGAAGAFGGGPKRAGVAQVQIARRRGGQAAEIRGRGRAHDGRRKANGGRRKGEVRKHARREKGKGAHVGLRRGGNRDGLPNARDIRGGMAGATGSSARRCGAGA